MTDQHEAFGAGPPRGRVAAFLLSDAVRVMVSRMQQYVDSAGHHIGLHRSDLTAMNIISQAARRGDRLTPSEVAQRMSLSPAAVTALVDRLAKAGHLERQADDRDRRRVRLDVSEQAVGVSMRMFRPLTAAMSTALEPYSDEELELVTRVLSDLSAAVEQADPTGIDLAGTPYAHRTDRPAGSRRSRRGPAPTLGGHETG